MALLTYTIHIRFKLVNVTLLRKNVEVYLTNCSSKKSIKKFEGNL